MATAATARDQEPNAVQSTKAVTTSNVAQSSALTALRAALFTPLTNVKTLIQVNHNAGLKPWPS